MKRSSGAKPTKRVLVISHTYAVPVRREKIKLLAQESGFEIGLIIPRHWEVGFDRSNSKFAIENSRLGKPYQLFDKLARDYDIQLLMLDVLVALSKQAGDLWKEQFGRVIIEDMACGAAVLGLSPGAIPEVVGDAGFIFREGSQKDLADQLKKLIQSQRLRTVLSRKGRMRVMANYTNGIIAQRTKRFWLKLGC